MYTYIQIPTHTKSRLFHDEGKGQSINYLLSANRTLYVDQLDQI